MFFTIDNVLCMTADEISLYSEKFEEPTITLGTLTFWLKEIAFQIAVLNQQLRDEITKRK